MVGPYALGLVVPGETALVLSEIGVVILLFSVGLEIKTDELLSVGRPAAVTATLGVIFPIAAGAGYALLDWRRSFHGGLRGPRPRCDEHRDHEPGPGRPGGPGPTDSAGSSSGRP